MAYVDTSALENEELDANSEAPGSGAPLSSGSAPSAPASSQPQGAKPKTPGNFADLSEYLRVNAPQNFGQQVAGKVGGDIQQGQQTLESAGQEFKKRADANTVTDSQGLAQKLGSSPTEVDQNEFAKIRDAQYGGPTNLSDAPDLYSQVQGSAGSAVGKANASKTESGRFALLDNYFGKPSYSGGQKSLDNLLVQNDPNSQQAFEQMRANAKNLQSNVNQAGVDLGGYGASAKAATENTRQAARNAIGIDAAGNATGTGAYGSVRGELSSASEAYQAALNRANSLAQAGKYRELSPEIQSTMDSLSGFYGVDPSKYYTANTGPVSDAAVASPEQLARIRALSQLAGQDDAAYQGADAGAQFGKDPYQFNAQGLKNEVNLAQQTFSNKANSLQGQLSDLQKQGVQSNDPRVQSLYQQMSALYSQYGVGSYVQPGTIRLG